MADDRVLLITGASTGIGAATARHAAEAGWRLVLAARSEDKLRALADELGGADRAVAQRCDVAVWEDQEALMQAALDAFGRVDAVFANAGFGGARGFLKETPEHWKSMVETNVTGVAFSIRAALPHFNERGSGHFLLTSSVAGRRPLPGSLYAATKHAVEAIGEGLRQELRQDDSRVRVTLIEPGLVATPFFDNPPEDGLEADDIARAVMYALDQPEHVDVNAMLVRPTAQRT